MGLFSDLASRPDQPATGASTSYNPDMFNYVPYDPSSGQTVGAPMSFEDFKAQNPVSQYSGGDDVGYDYSIYKNVMENAAKSAVPYIYNSYVQSATPGGWTPDVENSFDGTNQRPYNAVLNGPVGAPVDRNRFNDFMNSHQISPDEGDRRYSDYLNQFNALYDQQSQYQADPQGYANQKAQDLADAIFISFTSNGHGFAGLSTHEPENRAELEAMKQATPSAYYNAALSLNLRQAGWDAGQNKSNADTNATIQSLIQGAQASGISADQINNLVANNYTNTAQWHATNIAERKGQGATFQGIENIAPAMIAIVAAPFTGGASLAIGEAFLGAGAAGAATLGSAVLGSATSALYAAVSGGDVAKAAITGAIGGGVGAGVNEFGIDQVASFINPDDKLMGLAKLSEIAQSTGMTTKQVAGLVSNALSTTLATAATGGDTSNLLQKVTNSLASTAIGNYAGNLTTGILPDDLSRVANVVGSVGQVATSATLNNQDLNTALTNNLGNIIGAAGQNNKYSDISNLVGGSGSIDTSGFTPDEIAAMNQGNRDAANAYGTGTMSAATNNVGALPQGTVTVTFPQGPTNDLASNVTPNYNENGQLVGYIDDSTGQPVNPDGSPIQEGYDTSSPLDFSTNPRTSSNALPTAGPGINSNALPGSSPGVSSGALPGGTGTGGTGAGGTGAGGTGTGTGGDGTGTGGTGAGGTGTGTGGTGAGGTGTGTGGDGTGTGGTGVGGAGGGGGGGGTKSTGSSGSNLPVSSSSSASSAGTVTGALPGNLQSTSLAAAPVQETSMNLQQLKQLYPQLSSVDPRIISALTGKSASPSSYYTYGADQGGGTGLTSQAQGSRPSPGYPSIASSSAPSQTTFANPGSSSPFDALSSAGLKAISSGALPGINTYGLKKGGSPEHRGQADHIPEFITGATGHFVQGRGDGQSDDIPAMLADGEYVFDADTVAALGNGSSKAGALQLDKMRHAIRKHKRAASIDKIPPKAKSPLEYLKGSR
jgi:hypothetical protein